MREAQQKNARIYLVSHRIETVPQERIRTAEELGVHQHQETIPGVNRQI